MAAQGEQTHSGVIFEGKHAAERSTKSWIGVLLLLVLLSEEVAYAFNLVTPALPSMAARFHTTQVAWVSTAFQLAGACTAPLIGKFADAVGKKKMLLAVTLVMATGSVIVASAHTFSMVLAGRTLEGVGTAILPITYSLMRDIFPKRMLALAVSIATAGIGVTGIIAPNIAGWLIDHGGYQSVFWFLAAFPTALAVAIAIGVPESPIRVRTRIDWTGGLTLGAALTLLLLAISEGATWGWESGGTLSVAAAGVAALAVWWAVENKVHSPLIDVDLIRSRAVATTMVANFLAQAVIVVNFVLLAYVVQTPRALGAGYGLGESATDLAHFTTPAGIISVTMGFVVGWLAQRRGPRLPTWTGFTFAAVGTGMLAFDHYSTWQLVGGYFVYAVGGGLLSASIPNLVIAAVPVGQQAVSANMVGVIGGLGSTVGVQVAFALLGHHVHKVIQGAPIYSDQGFKIVYFVTAVLALIGFLVALVMRHGQRPESLEAAAGAGLVTH